ncbi:hypothetical protein [Actinoalloteichus caeruleus]|uniref:hypothetical protein n=1 Tax=Actinoalloteichus cyanogriseus TaxID=2893586 RepID=UPI0004AB6342|nr:hypothetical protein [Actinoalloteichus caeruleus]
MNNRLTGLLDGRGRLPWAQARELLTEHVCLWIDLDGIHLGKAPAAPPIATHLWARHHDGSRYARLRFDDDHAYVGLLDVRENVADGGAGEPVAVQRRPARLRSPRHARHALLDTLTVDFLEISGAAPVTFLDFDHPSATEATS